MFCYLFEYYSKTKSQIALVKTNQSDAHSIIEANEQVSIDSIKCKALFHLNEGLN